MSESVEQQRLEPVELVSLHHVNVCNEVEGRTDQTCAMDRDNVTGLGAVVLFARNVSTTTAFYQAIGLNLRAEDHGNGDVHFATDVDGVHFAVFASRSDTAAPAFRDGGSSLLGLNVHSVTAAVEAAKQHRATVLEEPTQYPWGLRAVIVDPDGRSVEVVEPTPR
jgi:predicted enzyme related to lactoylglutathione lyase